MLDDRRYTEDNYYRRGQFNITFQITPLDDELDEDARRRAVKELLYALRAETDLKISAFVDIFSLVPEDVDDTDERVADAEDEADEAVTAEFVVYNKLGITSLSKLRRFMEEHLLSEVAPRIVLVDPKTGKKFRATDFTIQYLFHDFVAGDPRGADWIRLRELLQSDDNGYAELTRTAMFTYRGARYVVARKTDLIDETALTKFLGNRKGKTFRCDQCDFGPYDADLNAASNHALDLVEIPNWVRYRKLNRRGFYWLGAGLFTRSHEPIVRGTQKAFHNEK
jgi:hypothetical protein